MVSQLATKPFAFIGGKELQALPEWEWSAIRKFQKSKVFIFADPGNDPDDHLTGAALEGTQEAGLKIDVLGWVVCLKPSEERTYAWNGFMKELGDAVTSVAGGSEMSESDDATITQQLKDTSACQGYPVAEGWKGVEMAAKALAACRDRSLTIILQSGQTDFASLIMQYPELVAEKVRSVIVMGGVLATQDGVTTDENGYMISEHRAANNDFDIPASEIVLSFCQSVGIKYSVSTRLFAQTANISPSFYEYIKKLGPAGETIYNVAKAGLDSLWLRTHFEEMGMTCDDVQLPPVCNPAWARKKFLGSSDASPELGKDSSLWDQLDADTRMLTPYDAMNLLTSIQPFVDRYFNPDVVEVVPLGYEYHREKMLDLFAKYQAIKRSISTMEVEDFEQLGQMVPTFDMIRHKKGEFDLSMLRLRFMNYFMTKYYTPMSGYVKYYQSEWKPDRYTPENMLGSETPVKHPVFGTPGSSGLKKEEYGLTMAGFIATMVIQAVETRTEALPEE